MSKKIKPLIEVLLGIIFVFGYLWLVSPLHSLKVKILFFIPIILFFIYSDFIDRKSFQDIGFSLKSWRGSSKILLVFTLTGIPLLYLIWHYFFPVNIFFHKDSFLLYNFVTKMVEALLQQYIFLTFFFRRYRDIFYHRTYIAVIFSALTFSMIHIPTPPLVIFCLIAGIVWAYTYNKYPNLFTIAISHAVLGIFCTSVLLVYSDVGPNADIGRWSKKDQISLYGVIDNIDYIVPYKNGQILDVTINQAKNSISVQGWVASTNKIDNIRISLGGRKYSIHCGVKREDVAAHFNNPDFLYSGFSANVPLSDFSPGYHKLLLEVKLDGEMFYHAPRDSNDLWVKLI